MADKTIDAKIVKKTQDTLGKIITKPALTEKLLSRPPIQYIHDIMASVIKTTGKMQGLFTESEMNWANLKENKEDKMMFIQKAIDWVSLVTGKPVSAKPSKILAGQEPEKTNEFLQVLAEAVRKNIDNDDYVRRVLKNDDNQSSSSRKKERDSSKSDRVNDRRTEDNEERDHSNDRRRNNDRGSRDKSRDPEVVGRDKESHSKSERKKEKHQNHDRDDHDDRGHEKDKNRDRHQDQDRHERKKEKDQRSKDNEERSKDKDARTKDRDERSKDKEGRSKDREERSKDKDGRSRDKEEKSKEKDRKSKDMEERSKEKERRSKDKEERSKDKEEKSRDREARSKDVDEDQDRDQLVRLQRPSSAKGSRRIQAKGSQRGDRYTDDDDDSGTATHLENRSSGSSARIARPNSGRPAPPKPKKNEISHEEPVVVTGLQKPNVIMDNHEDSDEEEMFVAKEEEILLPPESVTMKADEEHTEENEDDHGGLVKKLLESKKELEASSQPTQTKKTEIERSHGVMDVTRRKEREIMQKDIDKLRTSIQNTTRNVHPLGKLLDLIQENLDSMQKELEMWTQEHKENVIALQREQSISTSFLEPLKAQLQEVDSDIADQLDLIAAVKNNILQNDIKINKMLSSITKS